SLESHALLPLIALFGSQIKQRAIIGKCHLIWAQCSNRMRYVDARGRELCGESLQQRDSEAAFPECPGREAIRRGSESGERAGLRAPQIPASRCRQKLLRYLRPFPAAARGRLFHGFANREPRNSVWQQATFAPSTKHSAAARGDRGDWQIWI